MTVKTIFDHPDTKIFAVTNSSSDNELEWTIEPTQLLLIPDHEGEYIVKAKKVCSNRIEECYLLIITPERIAETVIKKGLTDAACTGSIYDENCSVIPVVGARCFGDYNLYYAQEDPQIGIGILKESLAVSENVEIVAEDLGYILRDEGQIQEAITAFEISAKRSPTSEFIYLELAQLYEKLGNNDKADEYQKKYEAC